MPRRDATKAKELCDKYQGTMRKKPRSYAKKTKELCDKRQRAMRQTQSRDATNLKPEAVGGNGCVSGSEKNLINAPWAVRNTGRHC